MTTLNHSSLHTVTVYELLAEIYFHVLRQNAKLKIRETLSGYDDRSSRPLFLDIFLLIVVS